MDLKMLLTAIRDKLWLCVAVSLLAMLITTTVSIFFITPLYESYTTILVTSNNKTGVVYTDILANRQLMKTYREIATSRAVASEIINKLELKTTPSQLAKNINVQLVNDTDLFKVSVRDSSAKTAKKIASLLSKVVMSEIIKVTTISKIEVLDPASEPVKPAYPKHLENTAIAGLASFILAIAGVLALNSLDDTLKSPEAISNLLDLPVLGVIPALKSSTGRG
jgi:capsular polysaccharide biosynthesis protein